MKNKKDTKVLFTCLLGTLIESTSGESKIPQYENGRGAFHNWKFKPGILQFIREKIMDHSYKLCIVSNMPEISEGVIKPEDANRLGIEVVNNIGTYLANTPYREGKSLNTRDIMLGQGFYVSDYTGSPNEKPNADLINRLTEEYGIDKFNSVVLGDGPNDEQLAINTMIPTYVDVDTVVTNENK